MRKWTLNFQKTICPWCDATSVTQKFQIQLPSKQGFTIHNGFQVNVPFRFSLIYLEMNIA